MRVTHATRFGGPEVLVAGEEPDPVAGPGQVVVDVAVSEILFLDTQLRSGWGTAYFTLEPPYVPGTGVAGSVRSVGDGVASDWIGRRVVARTGNTGGYAEQALALADEAFEVPAGLDLADALAALHDGLMAMQCLEKAALQPNELVLVCAAGGSLGVWLVPLAHAAGARVIAAARGPEKLDLARELGADIVVDYSKSNWAEQVRESIDGAGVDVVFDGAGGAIGRAAFDITARGGRFFSYGAASGDFATIDPHEAEQRQVTVIGILDERPAPEDQRRLTQKALAAVADATIRPVIGGRFPLDRAADAHTAIEARTVQGKTLLTVG